MRPVNLLPLKHRPRSGGGEDSKASYISLGVLGGLVLAVLVYVMSANQLNSNNTKLAETQARIQAAESQAVTLQGYGNFAGTKESRVAAVKSLATARLDWERLFRELAHVLPEEVWLTSFDGTAGGAPDGTATGTGVPIPTGPTVKLEGCAGGHSGVADVMVRLRGLHGVEDVELTESKKAEEAAATAAAPAYQAGGGDSSAVSDGCGDSASFKIDVTLAQAAPAPVTETVPASLGGGE